MLNVKCSESEGKSGIYCIICLENDKGYIGSSSNIYNRLSVHKKELKKEKHTNKYLQESWNKYGIDKFEFYIIEYCKKDILLEREQFYVNLYKTHYSLYGFNQAKIISGSAGYSFTEDQKKKVSDGVKRKLEDVEWKKARQAKITEFQRSDEGRKLASKKAKKMWQDPIIKDKIIKGMHDSGVFETRKITHNTTEFKQKASEITKKYFSDPVHRQEMSEIKIEQYANNPELIVKISENTKKQMQQEGMKQKIGNGVKKFNAENPEHVKEVTKKRCKIFATKEHRNKLSIIGKELWATDEHRNKIIAKSKERFSKQENKDKMKEISNSMWNDPVKYKATLEKRSNITKEQFEQLKELRKLGYNQSQIAKVLGCKKEAVGRICRGESKLFVLI